MNRPRWAADGPWLLLMTLGVGLLTALAAFVIRHAMPYDPFVACDTPWATFLARVGTLGLLVPLALLLEVLVATGLAVGHQLWITRRVLRQVLARSVPPDERLVTVARAVGLDGRLDVVRDEAVYTFCHGLLRPRVCITTALLAMLDEAELAAVLRHEAHHLQHGDPLKILTSRAVSSGLFFLPLAGGLHDAYLAAKELCADLDAAVDGDDLPLARALVKMFRAPRPRWPAGVLAVGSFSPTEARLQCLVNAARPRLTLPPPMDWLVSAAIVAAIFGFSSGAVAASEGQPVRSQCAVPATTALPRLPVAVAAAGAHLPH